ncbi:MAG: hypothetical protein AAF927_32030 [Bacteroidota bacterium]
MQKPYVLSPWVGPSIDQYEIWRFDLFASFGEDVESVSFYQEAENIFKVSIKDLRGTVELKEVGQAYINSLTSKIEDAIPKLLFDHAQLVEMSESGNLNVPIRLRLREAQVLSGTITQLRPMYLVISSRTGTIRVDLERIIEIEFGGVDFDTYYLGDGPDK